MKPPFNDSPCAGPSHVVAEEEQDSDAHTQCQ